MTSSMYVDGVSQSPVMSKEYSISQTVDSGQKYIEELEITSKYINQYLESDSKFPELAERLQLTYGSPTRSGLYDSEYINSSTSHRFLKQFVLTNRVPIPKEIMENASRIHNHFLMGTFPEIRRAWLVLDSDLFLWDFEYGSDVAYFDGARELILGIGLVKPKVGIFHDFVHYLLVLTTPSTIVVLGVTFSKQTDSVSTSDEMNITQEVIFSVPTDGIVFSTIMGTDNGRIFLGGKDGCLHEFVYQKELNWWNKQCWRVNHSSSAISMLLPSFMSVFSEADEIAQLMVDNSRQMVYTLSMKGTLDVYDLGETGLSTSKIATFNQSSVLNNVIRVMEERLHFGTTVSIVPVELFESAHICLIAILDSGFRVYFTISSNKVVSIAHVRRPPEYLGSNPSRGSSKIRSATCTKGTCLLVNSVEGCQEKLVCLSADLTTFEPGLREAVTIVPLDGATWSLRRFTTNLHMMPSIPEPPAVVAQHYEISARYVCLTDKGSEIYKKLRPVDVLRQIFEEGHDPGSSLVKSFLDTLPGEEICCMLLLLACQKVGSEQVSSVATRAFFLYSGEPRIVQKPPVFSPVSGMPSMLPPGFNPPSVSTPVGNRVIADQKSVAQFSYKHDGLYLFLSRTMRPVWQARIILCAKVNDKPQWIIPEVVIDRANLVCNHLQSLSAFLEGNNIVSAVSTGSLSSRFVHGEGLNDTPTNRRILQDLYQEEKKSLSAMKTFVTRANEVLNLWNVLHNHQFQIIANTLSPDELNFLSGLTFSDLILTGLETCNMLINKLLNLYLDDNSSVDAISTKLRDVCPSLFLLEDAASAKATEMILFSRGKLDNDEKQKLLEDSLKILKEVAPKLNLPLLCGHYLDAEFYYGIFELCQCCAQKIDPKNLALRYYHKGGHPYSPEYNAYQERLNCYREICTTLDYLHTTPKIIQHDRPPGNVTLLSSSITHVPCETQTRLQDMVNLCLSNDDEILHMVVYSWMMRKKLFGDLVACGRPSLEFFLRQSPAIEEFTPQEIKEILWMHFERQGNHAAAANILFDLAKETSGNISLDQRLHYLSHSLVCLKSDKSGTSAHMGVLFQEVEDTLEVAQIQMKIQKLLINKSVERPELEIHIKSLNSKLYNLTELYENYADPYHLWESKLEIIHCSNIPTKEDDIVHEIWDNIIVEELKNCISTKPNDKIAAVARRIKSIAEKLSTNSTVFDIDYLIFKLELVSCQLKASHNFVHNLMIELGIPAVQVATVYEKLYVENSDRWERYGNEMYVVESIGSFADALMRNERLSATQRQPAALMLNDLITHCLTMLYSKMPTEQIKQLMRWLKTVQKKLGVTD